MAEQQAYLRIREGAFTYLLAASRAVSIERRNRGPFELAAPDAGATVAWARTGGGRVPVVRLGALFGTRVADWAYAIQLSDGAEQIGAAAEHIYLIPESEIPKMRPFNPVGARTPGGPLITGVCPGTEPEYLVLDLVRLQHGLRRLAGSDET